MRRAILIGVLLLTAILWFVTAERGIAQEGALPDPPPFKPVMPLKSLMQEQDRHFGNMLDLLRDEQARERFNRLEHEAHALAEMANVNGYHERSYRHSEYRAWASQLKTQALEFAALAKAENVDGARSLAGQMNKTCKACHDKFEH